MKRATRYRIAKFNRFSTGVRCRLYWIARTVWCEITMPAEMAAAREMIERDRKASTLIA